MPAFTRLSTLLLLESRREFASKLVLGSKPELIEGSCWGGGCKELELKQMLAKDFHTCKPGFTDTGISGTEFREGESSELSIEWSWIPLLEMPDESDIFISKIYIIF
jgi:hypothetical protein